MLSVIKRAGVGVWRNALSSDQLNLVVARVPQNNASRSGRYVEAAAKIAGCSTRTIRSLIASYRIEPSSEEIVNHAAAINYIFELTCGVTGRIVELLRQSARVAIGRQTGQLGLADLQLAGKRFAANIGMERDVVH